MKKQSILEYVTTTPISERPGVIEEKLTCKDGFTVSVQAGGDATAEARGGPPIVHQLAKVKEKSVWQCNQSICKSNRRP